MLNAEAQRWLYRQEILNRCKSAVVSLMIPEQDLHLVDRDDLGCLLGLLTEESEHARSNLVLALSDSPPVSAGR